MWDLIVSVPDHCLSFYFSKKVRKGAIRKNTASPRSLLLMCKMSPTPNGSGT